MDLTLSLINSHSRHYSHYGCVKSVAAKSKTCQLKTSIAVHRTFVNANCCFGGINYLHRSLALHSRGKGKKWRIFLEVPFCKVPWKCVQILDTIRLQALSCIHMCSKTNSLGLFIVGFRLLLSRWYFVQQKMDFHEIDYLMRKPQ